MKRAGDHQQFNTEEALQARCVVKLDDLRISAYVGVYEHERGVLQPLIVDIEAEIVPPSDDRLDMTLDYDLVAEIARTLGRRHVVLIETFALSLAERCLALPSVLRVEVRVTKPNAICGARAATRASLSRNFPVAPSPPGMGTQKIT